MKKIVKSILLTICLVSIFLFSHQPATVSTKTSTGTIKTVVSVFYRNISNSELEEIVSIYETFIRKTAHLIIYLILGILTYIFVIEFMDNYKKAYLFSLLFCLLYAISDELHQYFIPGRSNEIRDVLIDCLGSTIGISIIYTIQKLKSRGERHERKNKQKFI